MGRRRKALSSIVLQWLQTTKVGEKPPAYSLRKICCRCVGEKYVANALGKNVVPMQRKCKTRFKPSTT